MSIKKENTKSTLFWLFILDPFRKQIKNHPKHATNIFNICYSLRRLNVECICGQHIATGVIFVLATKLNNSENTKIFIASVYHEQSAAMKLYAAAKSPAVHLFLYKGFLKVACVVDIKLFFYGLILL